MKARRGKKTGKKGKAKQGMVEGDDRDLARRSRGRYELQDQQISAGTLGAKRKQTDEKPNHSKNGKFFEEKNEECFEPRGGVGVKFGVNELGHHNSEFASHLAVDPDLSFVDGEGFT